MDTFCGGGKFLTFGGSGRLGVLDGIVLIYCYDTYADT